MVCLEIEKGWAFAFWRYQFKQDIQADVVSMLLWYTRENHPVISCHTESYLYFMQICAAAWDQEMIEMEQLQKVETSLKINREALAPAKLI